jgi:plastocyanin
VVAAALNLTIALAACADDGNADNANIVNAANVAAPETTAGSETSQRFEIEIVNFQFVPADAVVPAGTEVVWINKDTDIHSIVSTGGLFQSSDTFANGESYSIVLPDPGTYDYSCGVHPFMMGSITVQG